MSDDLREIFAQPTEIRLSSGKVIQARPINFEDFSALQKWIDDQQPSAMDAAEKQIIRGRLVSDGNGGIRREPYPEDMQKFLYDRALHWDSTRRVFLGSSEAEALLRSQSGVRQLARMALKKGTPNVTDAEIDEVLGKMDDQERIRAAMAAEAPRSGRPKANGLAGGQEMTPTIASVSSAGENLSES